MNPKNRRLERVTINERDADITEETINGLLGKDVEVRYEMLMELLSQGGGLEVTI
jgi:DNA gyrase/topoisomerase IV subunit B